MMVPTATYMPGEISCAHTASYASPLTFDGIVFGGDKVGSLHNGNAPIEKRALGPPVLRNVAR